MQIKYGEAYTGPGKADPAKSREEREIELRELLQTAAGREILDYYFLKYTGALQGKMPAVGTPMVQTILSHEYPKG